MYHFSLKWNTMGSICYYSNEDQSFSGLIHLPMPLIQCDKATHQEALFNWELVFFVEQRTKTDFFFFLDSTTSKKPLSGSFDRSQSILNSPKRLLKILSTYIAKENFSDPRFFYMIILVPNYFRPWSILLILLYITELVSKPLIFHTSPKGKLASFRGTAEFLGSDYRKDKIRHLTNALLWVQTALRIY